MLTGAELASVRRQAERDYPAECCGVLLVRAGAEGGRRLMACRNVQDALHAKDPARFPRTSRTAYYIAHEDLLAIGRQEAEGWAVEVIYHSHVDAGAYFSETDRRNAMLDGEPTYPGATYVVVSVRGGRAEEARAFRWDAAQRDFVERPLEPENR